MTCIDGIGLYDFAPKWAIGNGQQATSVASTLLNRCLQIFIPFNFLFPRSAQHRKLQLTELPIAYCLLPVPEHNGDDYKG
jgi:hypothetical protein